MRLATVCLIHGLAGHPGAEVILPGFEVLEGIPHCRSKPELPGDCRMLRGQDKLPSTSWVLCHPFRICSKHPRHVMPRKWRRGAHGKLEEVY